MTDQHAEYVATEAAYNATNLLDWVEAEEVARAVLQSVNLGPRAEGMNTSHIGPQGRSEAECDTPPASAVGGQTGRSPDGPSNLERMA